MNGRPYIRRAIRAMKRGRPLPVDVAEFLVPALEAVLARPAVKFEEAAGLGRGGDDQKEHIARAASMMAPHLSVSDCIRKMRRVAGKLEYIGLDEEAEDLLRDGWELEILEAMRLADLPGDTTLHKVCKKARIEKNAA